MTCQAWVLPYKVRNDVRGAVFDVKRLRIGPGNCLNCPHPLSPADVVEQFKNEIKAMGELYS